MEVYILDSLLRRIDVVDKFESLIWTERFREFGDFQLVVRSTQQSRAQFKNGVQLAMNESYRVMTVETVEDGTDEDGKRILTVTGNSIESILLDRVAKASLASTGTWDITDTPAAIARKIFHDICVTGVLDPGDKIDFVNEAMHPKMVTSNIPEPIDPIIANLPVQTVYDAIKDICDVWTLGFRLLLDFEMNQLYWDVYSGSDRTSGQTTRPPVIFAPDLDNLTNTKELSSIESSKNVAYVFAKNGSLIVYPEDVDPLVDSFERRVLIVEAQDIELPAGAALDSAMLQRGKEEISKNRAFQAFDGEINRSSQYKYQVDYYLGDLVELQNDDGVANQMRVTEQIFSSDSEGERNYPTLTMNTFINTGSWLSQRTKTWLDYDADPITWSEMP